MGMQHRVQMAVLHAVAREPLMDRAAILTSVPGADRRDLERALEILISSGAVGVDLGDLAPTFRLTTLGKDLVDA